LRPIPIGNQDKQTASADNTGPANPPVGQVTPGSNADQSGMQAGNVILRIAGNDVTSPSEAADAIHAAEHQNKTAISLLVMRDGAQAVVGLQLAAG
jgi:serine protease Do